MNAGAAPTVRVGNVGGGREEPTDSSLLWEELVDMCSTLQ